MDEQNVSVWGVYEGLYGYLSNSMAFFKTREEAIDYAEELKSEWEEQNYQDDDPYAQILVTGDIEKDESFDICKVNLSWDFEKPHPDYPDTDIDLHEKWVSWQYISVEEVDMEKDEWDYYQENGMDY